MKCTLSNVRAKMVIHIGQFGVDSIQFVLYNVDTVTHETDLRMEYIQQPE